MPKALRDAFSAPPSPCVPPQRPFARRRGATGVLFLDGQMSPRCPLSYCPVGGCCHDRRLGGWAQSEALLCSRPPVCTYSRCIEPGTNLHSLSLSFPREPPLRGARMTASMGGVGEADACCGVPTLGPCVGTSPPGDHRGGESEVWVGYMTVGCGRQTLCGRRSLPARTAWPVVGTGGRRAPGRGSTAAAIMASVSARSGQRTELTRLPCLLCLIPARRRTEEREARAWEAYTSAHAGMGPRARFHWRPQGRRG